MVVVVVVRGMLVDAGVVQMPVLVLAAQVGQGTVRGGGRRGGTATDR